MTEPKKPAIEIHIKMPGTFSIPFSKQIRAKYASLNKKRRRLVQAVGLIIIIAVIATLTVLLISAFLTVHPTQTITKTKDTSLQKTPDYPTVLPEGKTITDFGGWTRVSPPDRNPVFAYVDTINGKQINVSEQPLPPEFKEDTNSQVEQLAAGYKATEKVTVGDITVYIGTSAKGPQSVIFVKNNILVLIKSSLKVSDDDWAKYVNSLK
ncbi:MAG: hypothetical protein ABIP50_01070 [Candidatus Saccharimonadales bacterium]